MMTHRALQQEGIVKNELGAIMFLKVFPNRAVEPFKVQACGDLILHGQCLDTKVFMKDKGPLRGFRRFILAL
jgi:hypothetical protein